MTDLQTAFQETGTQLDRIANALERKPPTLGYTVYYDPSKSKPANTVPTGFSITYHLSDGTTQTVEQTMSTVAQIPAQVDNVVRLVGAIRLSPTWFISTGDAQTYMQWSQTASLDIDLSKPVVFSFKGVEK